MPRQHDIEAISKKTILPRIIIAKYWMRWLGSRFLGHIRARCITQLSCGCGSDSGNPCNGKTITITQAEQITKNKSFFNIHIITGDINDSL